MKIEELTQAAENFARLKELAAIHAMVSEYGVVLELETELPDDVLDEAEKAVDRIALKGIERIFAQHAGEMTSAGIEDVPTIFEIKSKF